MEDKVNIIHTELGSAGIFCSSKFLELQKQTVSTNVLYNLKLSLNAASHIFVLQIFWQKRTLHTGVLI